MTIKKTITIFGATGSIGESTLKLISQHRSKFNIYGMTANNNSKKLLEIAKQFKPKKVVILNYKKYKELKSELSKYNIEVNYGNDHLIDLAKQKVDCIIAGISGFAGIDSVFSAIEAGQNIALANKESLVVAGHLIMPLIKKTNAKIIPIDSEHNAIFQCLLGQKFKDVKKIILTASGGPFLNTSIEKIKDVNVSEALNHPNWKMGKKVTIDSATLMNKGLELIEAYWLFGKNKLKLDAVIHPQSIIHGLVGYNDGSWLAQLGLADMRIPISYALGFPERLKWNHSSLSFDELMELSFKKIDNNKFPCFGLAKAVIADNPSYSVILNSANELAVKLFLEKKICFGNISILIEKSLNLNVPLKVNKLDDIHALNNEIQERALQFVNL